MKRILGVLAGSAMMLAASTLQAQTFIDGQVQVKVNSFPFQTIVTGYTAGQGPAVGGGFRADFEIDFPAPTGTLKFSDYIVWCIDSGRGINTGSTYTYQLWSLKDFAASANKSTTNHDPDLDDMTRIASLQSELETNWNVVGTPKANLQGSIWSWFDGYSTYAGKVGQPAIMPGNPNFNISEYYVLWNGSNQTLLTRIPEPSSALVVLAGLGAMMVTVSRRRRIS